jgi:hypothetical protein
VFTEPTPHKLRISLVRVFLLRGVPDDKFTRLLILGRHERPRERVVQAEVSRPLSRDPYSAGDALVVRLYDRLDAADIFGPGRNNSDRDVGFRFLLRRSVRHQENKRTQKDSKCADFHLFPPEGKFRYGNRNWP